VQHTHDEDGTPLTFVHAVAANSIGQAVYEAETILIELDD